MPAFRKLIEAFFGGELSPYLVGRVNSDNYRFGLETCENWIPTIEGPLVKRSGFSKIRDADPTSTWLTAFRRSVTQDYVVEWGEKKARFFTNGGRIETAPDVAYEIVTPFAAADVSAMCLEQSFDRQYIAHASYAPSALRRDSAITFAIETLTLNNGPFADQNGDQSITVSASAGTGSGITLTANSAIFDAGQVGSPIRIEAGDFGSIPAWQAGMKGITAGSKCVSDNKVYQAATGGTTGTVQPTHTAGSYYDGMLTNDQLNNTGPYGVEWTYLYDLYGIATITAVASSTSATATVTRRLPDSVVGTPTWRWSLGAFNSYAGWPHLVRLYKGRLCYFKDYQIFGSVVGDYGGGQVNFATFTDSGQLAADLSFRRTMAISDSPLWVARDRRLIVGTATEELAIGALNSAAALSGENIEAVDQSFYGGEAVSPIQVGTATLFVQRGGKRLRSADFDFARDRYDAIDLTAAARHITGTSGAFLQLTYQREPQEIVFAPRTDGQIVVHPASRMQIKGFSRYVLGGGAKCLSAVSIVGADGRTEELWALIERTAGDGVTTLREIWKQEPQRQLGDPQDQAFYADGGVQIAAAAGQTTFHGLTHLASQSVAVLANGGVVPDQVVDATGTLTLPATSVPANSAFTVIVGLPYTATAVGLPPEFQVQGGDTSQGLIQRVLKLTLRLVETMGIKVGTPDPNDPLEEIIDRSTSSAMDAPIPLASGDYGGNIDAEFDRAGTPRWVSSDPLPAVVAAAVLKIDVDTRDV